MVATFLKASQLLVASHTLFLLPIHVVSALTIHVSQLPHTLKVRYLPDGVVTKIKREAFVETVGVDQLFQLLCFAPGNLLSCHGRPLPRLALLPLLSPAASQVPSTSATLPLTLVLTFFNDVAEELFFLVGQLYKICPTATSIGQNIVSVSYTHLTLPTSQYV